jgi:hypothetical protein
METRVVSNHILADQEIDQVEDQLFDSFRPVIPDPEFVRRLQHRLLVSPDTIIEPRFKIENIFIILIGISTGFIVLLFLKRMITKMLALFAS